MSCQRDLSAKAGNAAKFEVYALSAFAIVKLFAANWWLMTVCRLACVAMSVFAAKHCRFILTIYDGFAVGQQLMKPAINYCAFNLRRNRHQHFLDILPDIGSYP